YPFNISPWKTFLITRRSFKPLISVHNVSTHSPDTYEAGCFCLGLLLKPWDKSKHDIDNYTLTVMASICCRPRRGSSKVLRLWEKTPDVGEQVDLHFDLDPLLVRFVAGDRSLLYVFAFSRRFLS